MSADRSSCKFNKEFRDIQAKEMMRFNGKAQGVPDTVESISEATSDDRSKLMLKQSAMKQGAHERPNQHKQTKFADELYRDESNLNLRDQEIDDAIATLN